MRTNRRQTRRTYSKINSGYLWVVKNSDDYFYSHFSVFSKLSTIICITLTKKKKTNKVFYKQRRRWHKKYVPSSSREGTP